MSYNDGELIDFLRGELSPAQESAIQEALATDAALQARLDSIAATFQLTAALPDLKPAFGLRRELSDELENIDQQTRESQADEAASMRIVKAALPSMDDAGVADRLRASLAQAMAADAEALSQASPETSESSEAALDRAVLVDYWADELSARERRDVEALLGLDDAFAAQSRVVARVLRVMAPLTISPSTKEIQAATLLQDRLLADALPLPDAENCEIIDDLYGALNEAESQALARRKAAKPALVIEESKLESLLVTLRRVPSISPSQGLRNAIKAALKEEEARAQAALSDAEVGRRWEVLRGHAPSEYAEAMIEDDAASLEGLSANLRQIQEVPSIAPSAEFKARLVSALAEEAMHHRSSTDSERMRALRLIPSRPEEDSKAPLILAEARRLDPKWRAKKRGQKRSTARALIAASIMHLIALTAAMAIILGARDSNARNWSIAEGGAGEFGISHLDGSSKVPSKKRIDEGRSTGPRPEGFVGFEVGPLPVIEDTGFGGIPEAMPHRLVLPVDRRLEGLDFERVLIEARERELEGIRRDARANNFLAKDGARNGGGGGENMFYLRFGLYEEKLEVFGDDAQGGALLKVLEETLARLISDQRADGSWSDRGGKELPVLSSDLEWQQEAREIENTSLALLALLGDGARFGAKGDRDQALTKGIRFLLHKMNDSGGFVSLQEDGAAEAQGVMHADAMASLAIVEAYASSRARELALPMRRVARRVQSAQRADGSWAYIRGGDADMPTSLWAMQALQAAGHLGWNSSAVEESQAAFERWLKSLSPIFGGRPEVSGQTSSRAQASGIAAFAAAREKYLSNRSGVLPALTTLSSNYYRPSFEAQRAVGATRLPAVNFTAWYFGSMAAYRHRGEAGAADYLNALYGSLVDKEGNARFASFAIQHAELESKQGYVMSDALAALTIENAYRMLRSE